MEQRQKQTLSDFQQEVLADRKIGLKKIWQKIAVLAVIFFAFSIFLWGRHPENILMNSVWTTIYFFIIMFSIWSMNNGYRKHDLWQIQSLENQKKAAEKEATRYHNRPKLLAEHPEIASAQWWVGLPRYAELASEKDAEVLLIQQKIDCLKVWPWELIARGWKIAITAMLLNIIVIGSVWVFIPWFWLCIVLSIIILIVDFIIFAIWGMALTAYLQYSRGYDDLFEY